MLVKSTVDYTQLNIYVWGMGAKGKDFWNRYAYFETIYDLLPSLRPNIVAVVDSSCEGDGQSFFGRSCLNPQQLKFCRHEDLFVIAVERNAGIRHSLMEKGYAADNMIFYEDFLDLLRSTLLFKREYILKCFFKKISLKFCSIDDISLREDMFKGLSIACKELNALECSPQCKNLLRAVLLSEIFKFWDDCCETLKSQVLQIAKDIFNITDILAGAELYYGMDIRILSDYFQRYITEISPKKVKVIGIYDKRYRNGGGQKVISMLMPIYIAHGYKVVFFTEEYSQSDEYIMADKVKRIVLPKEFATDRQGRWHFLLKHIREQGVQVMCFHNCESAQQFFFDTLWLHMHDIPVIMEMHMNFMSLFESRSRITHFLPYIYKLVERLIVLSKSDEIFWQNLGCQAIYIPNPLGEIKRTYYSEAKTGRRILWIGRLEDGGKRFSEAVDIMKLVVKEVPEARLDVVGRAENEIIEKRLRADINIKGLADNIVLHGYTTDVGKFYEQADVMLFTSRREGFPLVIVESKQYGLPLVMYELPYLELLRNGQGFISVPQGDKQAAARALVHLLTDEKLRIQMSAEAEKSLDWLREYDIGGAWDKIFAQIGEQKKKATITISEFCMVEKLLLEGVEDCKWER